MDFVTGLLRLDTRSPGGRRTGKEASCWEGTDKGLAPSLANLRHFRNVIGQLDKDKKRIRHTNRCRFGIEDEEGRITHKPKPTTAHIKLNLLRPITVAIVFLVIAMIA